MIKGSVTPPVAYLSAVEILHRQFAAFLVDSLDINAERQPLVNAGDVYDESGGKVSLTRQEKLFLRFRRRHRQPLVNAGDVYDESGGKVSLASLVIARVRDGISD